MNKANNQTPPKVAPALKAGYKEIKIEKSVEEMATEIACSIYQSPDTLEDIKATMSNNEGKCKDLKTTMDYVALVAVKTARRIKEFSTVWEKK